MSTAAATPDVLQTMDSMHRFTAFLQALDQAGVVEDLRGAGPFTVFAPTNAAMDRLPQQTLNDLLRPGNEDLLYDIMSYHIVPGEIHAADLDAGKQLTSLGGQHLTTCKDQAGVICLDRSHILQGDIACANGILHAIDKVLLPGNRD